jgi:hypothetical protein
VIEGAGEGSPNPVLRRGSAMPLLTRAFDTRGVVSLEHLDANGDVPAEQDGRRDFDFLHGRWRSHNQKLTDVLDKDCTDWIEFEAAAEARPIMDGLGNVENFWVVALPDGRPFEGLTLRLFDPTSCLWRIWWASTTRPGHMDPPVEGRFVDGHGQFFCDDVLNGHPVKVRFDWTHSGSESARFEQAFSYDEGHSWKTNWINTQTRES